MKIVPFFFFYKLQVCGNLASSKPVFLTAFFHFVSSHPLLGILKELEVKPEDGTELLQPHEKKKKLMVEELLPYGWAKKMVSWDRSYSWWRCREDCWNDNEGFRTQDKLSWTEFERTDSGVERGATVDRLLSNSCACLERNDSGKEVNRCGPLH